MSKNKKVREFVDSCFQEEQFRKLAWGERKYELASAVIDCALISLRVRDGGLFFLRKNDEQMMERFRTEIGVDHVRLADFQGGATFFVFRKGDSRIRRLALDHKECFGEKNDAKCNEVTLARGHPWDTAGIAFGYKHPGSVGEYGEKNGGLSFRVSGFFPDRSIDVMGPQSVNLSDPQLFEYAIERCRLAQAALGEIKVTATFWCDQV